MLRERFNDRLKEALKAKDQRALSAVRLILAALKDRDIAARSKGNKDGITDDEILQMLQAMVKQRRESIELYRKGGRADLAEQEEGEIAVISTFMPQQLDEAGMAQAVAGVVGELGASSVKDMGRVMAALKERYAGRMDFSKASALVKQRLA
jgi:uncharacterized protein